MAKNKTEVTKDVPVYISPKELAHRWQVSRNTVMYIARDHGFTALFLGDKKSSTIRYLREEVILFEKTRMTALQK